MTTLLLMVCLGLPITADSSCWIARSVHADLRACMMAKAVVLLRPEVRRGECHQEG